MTEDWRLHRDSRQTSIDSKALWILPGVMDVLNTDVTDSVQYIFCPELFFAIQWFRLVVASSVHFLLVCLCPLSFVSFPIQCSHAVPLLSVQVVMYIAAVQCVLPGAPQWLTCPFCHYVLHTIMSRTWIKSQLCVNIVQNGAHRLILSFRYVNRATYGKIKTATSPSCRRQNNVPVWCKVWQ